MKTLKIHIFPARRPLFECPGFRNTTRGLKYLYISWASIDSFGISGKIKIYTSAEKL